MFPSKILFKVEYFFEYTKKKVYSNPACSEDPSLGGTGKGQFEVSMLRRLARYAVRTALITGVVLLTIWLASLALGQIAKIDWRLVAGITFGITALVTPVISVFWVSSSRKSPSGSSENYIDTLHFGGGGDGPD